MNFREIAEARQSCRSFDPSRDAEPEKIRAILESAILAPSACNGQPYHFTVCRGDNARLVGAATTGMGMNKFTQNAPIMIVVSEKEYVASAALGAKVKKNDYRSIDIGITTAYLTAEACVQGLSTCILGWFDNNKIREICSLDGNVRLVIAVGYASGDDKLRTKKRKNYDEIVTEI